MIKPKDIELIVIDTIDEMNAAVNLQNLIWGNVDPAPAHLLITAAGNGGLVIGAYSSNEIIGFLFGFLGLYKENDITKLKHSSHMLGIHPEHRNQGIGFMLKRAQWQLVRQQGIELVTWTYDPLESVNAYVNISKLGGISKTYKQNLYGSMSDELNAGIMSDRFQVDWWLNSRRVNKRLSNEPRRKLDLAHFLDGGAETINSTKLNNSGFPVPHQDQMDKIESVENQPKLVLFEIPSDFQEIKSNDLELAKNWRMYSRTIFELFFHYGYLITDFIYLEGKHSRCYYVLSQGDSTLGAME